ncbi:1-acyl-sn-glycerol-3-phosphate acyltransferase [bacterium]|nr:1-acyl-sn-glycerol-3-phosphate acyltransferase [bacterium]
MILKYTQKFTRISSGLIARFFLNLEITGMENFEKLKKNALFVANHHSRFDPFIIGGCIPKNHSKKIECYRFMTYYKFIWQKWYGWFLFISGAYPVYKKTKSLKDALAKTINLLKKNQSVLIFPTGRTSEFFSPDEARPGLGYIIKEINPQIIPVFVGNTYNISFKECLLRKRKTKIIFGKPFFYNDVKAEDTYKDISKKVMRKVEELK